MDLEEKPQNMVELEIGGEGSPFLLRLLHLKQNLYSNLILDMMFFFVVVWLQ